MIREKTLSLHFSCDDGHTPQLIFVHFLDCAEGIDCKSVRSKRYAVPRLFAGCFEWTVGIHAIAILLVRSALQRFSGSEADENVACGELGKLLARVLLNVVQKSPDSACALFGSDGSGRSNLRHLFIMPHKSSTVLKNRYVFLNENFLGRKSIRIFVNGKELLRCDSFKQLLSQLEARWEERMRSRLKKTVFACNEIARFTNLSR